MTMTRELRRLARAAEHGTARAIMSLPTPLRRALLRGQTTQRDGAPLDPDVELMILLAKLSKKGLALDLPLGKARRRFIDETNVFAKLERPRGRVEEQRIDEHVRVRVYSPEAPAANEEFATSSSLREASRPAAQEQGPAGARAGLVYFHGGGFVLGGFESHDVPCRRLAREAGVVVVAVDYRLAPESPFPTAVTDSLAAFRWTASHAPRLGIDPARLGVGGDSAGGNLAAVVALETRGDSVRPRAQILIYPAVDFTMSSASIDGLGEGFILEKASIEWFRDQYLGAGDRRDPRASPLFRRDLAGAPSAVVHVAGFDPLRDEGLAYAAALRHAGTSVVLRNHETLFHGFLNTTMLPAADRAVSSLALDVEAALDARTPSRVGP
jgi:acetyl esterase